ncbi:Oxoglutarate/iron-dependent dioxygenase [Trema orientale]|uniref:Oxoglutarate/iron-dependent dioxygenase n=1 Tax=Trema orientale TaxID=63057 RepID=A0A2P5EHH6_TREOI|nr:Oxoglutarate/iron-dependent dioxygenase [Trema orientale]
MNYYPPCPQLDLVISLNPHSDATGLTILLSPPDQRNRRRKAFRLGEMGNRSFLNHCLVSNNAFIVNIGDMLEVLFLY